MKKILFILFGLYLIGICLNYCNAESFEHSGYSIKRLPSMNEAGKANSSLVLLNDGRVLISGGMRDSYNSTNIAEIYDPKLNKFIKIANMNIPRTGHSSVLLSNGNVLIVGGTLYSSKDISKSLKSAEIYDAKKNKFFKINDMNFVMTHPKTMRTKDDKIIIFCNNSELDLFDEVTYKFTKYKYSSINNLKKDIANQPPLVKGIKLHNGDIIFMPLSEWGDKTIKIMKSTTQDLVLLSNKFPKKLIGQNYEILNDDKLMVIGSDSSKETNSNNHNKAAIYNYKNGDFEKTYNLNVSRDSLDTIPLNNGNIFVAGGNTWHYGTLKMNAELSNKTELFSFEENKFTKLPNRYNHGKANMIKLNNGNILILGNNKKPELLVIKKGFKDEH